MGQVSLFSFFNPDVSKLQFVCAEVPVYKHASGHRDHVFTTACLEIQHALPHASVSTGLSLAFTGLRGITFYNCLYYFIWWCENDQFHLAGDTKGVLSHLIVSNWQHDSTKMPPHISPWCNVLTLYMGAFEWDSHIILLKQIWKG